MVQQSPNKLLAALPAADYRRLLVSLQTVHLHNNEALVQCGEGRVYFPGKGVCSVGSVMEDGRVIEIAAVGNEGIVGLSLLAGDTPTFQQVSNGSAQFMTRSAFEREVERGGALRPLIDRYSRMFLESVMQSAACNRLHSLQERCCRWLLISHDRIGRDRFELTQAFLARALGVKPQELAVVMRTLSNLRVLEHHEQSVTILDAEGLRCLSCDCYRIIKKQFKALLDTAVAGAWDDASHDEPTSSAKVVPLRPAFTCDRCGSAVSLPHSSEDECIRSIDAEIRVLIRRAHSLHKQRGQLVQQRLQILRGFLEKRRANTAS